MLQQQYATPLLKRDPTETAAELQRQPSAPQLQAYHLATVAPHGEQVHVSLNNAATWRKFSRQNTEMIVTKAGRRMFPSLSLEIRGLDPVKKYEIYVTLLLADQRTLKYQRGVWIPNGPGEVYPPPGCSAGLVYVHPDSPATGRQWCKQEVTFMKLKLTNKLDGFEDPSRNGSMIFAYSMHKYLPVIHVSEVPGTKPDVAAGADRFYTSVLFPGTEFTTVTAYQNPELTDLKIQFNPYAKGIRNQTDRSSTIMIDTFRPTVQAMQQQHRQQPMHHQQQLQQRPKQEAVLTTTPGEEDPQPRQQQAPASQLPAGFEFGSYPSQVASSYGHWQQPAPSRRYQPYSLQTVEPAVNNMQQQTPVALTAAQASSSSHATSCSDESPASPLVDEFAASESAAAAAAAASSVAAAAAAASAAAAAAYYPGQYSFFPHHHNPYHHHQQQQQQLEQQQQQSYHHHLYYAAQHYYSSQQPGQHDQLIALSSTDAYQQQLDHQQQQQQPQQQQSYNYGGPLTPPSQQTIVHDDPAQLLSQQQQQQQQQQQTGSVTAVLQHLPHAVAIGQATPQGCSMLASSSLHVTDSSPSGVSFNSPGL